MRNIIMTTNTCRILCCIFLLILLTLGYSGKTQEASEDSAKSQETSGDSVKSQEASGDSVKSQEASGDSVKSQEAVGHSAKSQDAAGDSVKRQEASGDSVKSQEAVGHSAKSQDVAGDSVKSQEASGDSAKSQETSGDSVKSQDATGDSVKSQDTAGDSAKSQETSGDSVKSQDAAGDSGGKSQEATEDLVKRQEAVGDSVKRQEASGDSSKRQEASGDSSKSQEASGDLSKSEVAQEDVDNAQLEQQGILDITVNNLNATAVFIKTAHYASVAAGPKFTELQLKVRSIALEVSKVTKDLRLTLFTFESGSNTVLERLNIIYEYLQEKSEDLALVSMEEVRQEVSEVSQACEELRAGIEGKLGKAEAVLKVVHGVSSVEAARAANDKDRKKELEELLAEDVKALQEVEEKMEEVKDRMRENEEAGREFKDPETFMESLLEALKFIYTTICRFLNFYVGWPKCPRQKTLEAVSKERREHLSTYMGLEIKLEDVKTQLNDRRKALNKLEPEAKDFSPVEANIQHIIRSLHAVQDVLKDISAFFVKMDSHTQRLVKNKFLTEIKDIAEESAAAEAPASPADAFRKGALPFSEKWAAIGAYAGRYSRALDEVQERLYAVTKDNPTWQEAAEWLKGRGGDSRKHDEL